MNIESTLNKHELFPPTWSTPEAGMIFPLCRVSHRWMESTASFLDVLYTNVRYLRKKKKSIAELLTVKGIQVLLTFCWGFQPQLGVINLDAAF